MDEWMNERLGEAQAVSWKIAIVRAVHGATVDAFSIDELVAEYVRMRGTIVIVKHEDGTLRRMSELDRRLAHDRVG
jgi:hypothetical protein